MRRFRFTLEPLSTLRERQEQLALQRYGEAVQQVELARKKLEAIEAELAAAWTDLKEWLVRGCAAVELIHRQNHCRRLEQQQREQADHLARAREQAKTALERLLESKKASGVVEKFRELQKRRYDQERREEEQKRLDEFSQRLAEPTRWTRAGYS